MKFILQKDEKNWKGIVNIKYPEFTHIVSTKRMLQHLKYTLHCWVKWFLSVIVYRISIDNQYMKSNTCKEP